MFSHWFIQMLDMCSGLKNTFDLFTGVCSCRYLLFAWFLSLIMHVYELFSPSALLYNLLNETDSQQLLRNKIAVTASFIKLSSKDVVWLKSNYNRRLRAFSDFYFFFCQVCSMFRKCMDLDNNTQPPFWKYRTRPIRRVDSQVLPPLGLPLFF